MIVIQSTRIHLWRVLAALQDVDDEGGRITDAKLAELVEKKKLYDRPIIEQEEQLPCLEDELDSFKCE